MILTENRFTPRIKCGAGFFRDHARTIFVKIVQLWQRAIHRVF
jgi:hypothetical protein